MAKDEKDLRTVEKAMVKLRNKLNRADLNYTVQTSINSTDPTKLAYAAQMTAPAEGLAPITFISYNSYAELAEMIKAASKNIDLKAVEIAYHKAQVEACQRTIAFHEERLNRLENPESEEPNETEAQPNTEEGNASGEEESTSS